MVICYCTNSRTVARRLTALYDTKLAPSGLTAAQFALLRQLDLKLSRTVTELAHRMDLDRSTVGRNVRVLAKQGVVDLGSRDDQRETAVFLTDDGQRRLEQGGPLWKAAQAEVELLIGKDRTSGILETAGVLAAL